MDHVTLSISIDTQDVRVLLKALADALGTQDCTQSIKAEAMQSEVQTETSETVPTENSDEIDYEKKFAEAETEILQLRKEKEESERKLKDQIQKLGRRISAYEPYAIGDDREEMYFKVERQFLTRTYSEDAPYIATKLPDGKALFRFNVDRGPTTEAFKEKEEMLTPFCDIEEQDGATGIQMVKPGEGTLTQDGTQITVLTRAKVKLIIQ